MEGDKVEKEHKVHVGQGNDMGAEGKKTPTPTTSQGSNSVLFVILLTSATVTAGVWYQTHLLGQEIKTLVKNLHESKGHEGTAQQQHIQPVTNSRDDLPADCYDINLMGEEKSGLYKVYPQGVKNGVSVYCDMETDDGGWLVMMRRRDGSTDFSQDWDHYLAGFGDMQNEFWLGNELLHTITKQGWYQLRIDMSDFEGETRYAKYKVFKVDSSSTAYQLTIAGYSGDAGNSLQPHNKMKFSTKDFDNDNAGGSCATSFKGGFWYNNCHHANPTGQYIKGEHETVAIGINWFHWKGYKYSLKTIEMKIKPL